MPPQTNQSSPKILIIGGGIGGLTLGQALLQHGIPFRIFERDNSSSYRAQGYRIRLSGDGVFAMQKCLPRSVWETLEASAAGGILALTKLDALTGEEANVGPNGPGVPRGPPTGNVKGIIEDVKPIAVDRTVMRHVLLTGVEEYIEYGKEFQRYEVTESGITAYFSDGTSHRGGLLVGADGVRSVVRKQYLPQLRPVDTDGRCIYGKTYITDALTSLISPRAQNNMTVIQQQFEDGTPLTLFLEPTRFPNRDVVPILNPETGKKEGVKDYIYWVLLSRSRVFQYSTSDLLQLAPEQAAELSIQLTQNWHETFTSILKDQSKLSASALRISSGVPDLPSWKPSARITILGDAAHPMPPAGGLGAVSALQDVAKLVDVIVEEGGITGEGIGRYEEEMRNWANEALRSCRTAGEKFYGQVPWEEAEPIDF